MVKKNRKRNTGSAPARQNRTVTQAESPSIPLAPPAEKIPAPAPVKPDVLPLLLTLAQLCDQLNVSRSTIFRMEKAGKIPGRVNIGGSVRYHRQVTEEWIMEKAKGQEGNENDSI